jgi:hypothetical protein
MKIKTIIIGMGSAGALDRFIDKRIKFQRNHLDAIKNNKSFQLVKLVDKNENNILKKKKTNNKKYYA